MISMEQEEELEGPYNSLPRIFEEMVVFQREAAQAQATGEEVELVVGSL